MTFGVTLDLTVLQYGSVGQWSAVEEVCVGLMREGSPPKPPPAMLRGGKDHIQGLWLAWLF